MDHVEYRCDKVWTASEEFFDRDAPGAHMATASNAEGPSTFVTGPGRYRPSVERALARIEAALIEANPDHAMNEGDGEFSIDKSLERISFDEDLVIKSVDDESIPLIDLTESE